MWALVLVLSILGFLVLLGSILLSSVLLLIRGYVILLLRPLWRPFVAHREKAREDAVAAELPDPALFLERLHKAHDPPAEETDRGGTNADAVEGGDQGAEKEGGQNGLAGGHVKGMPASVVSADEDPDPHGDDPSTVESQEGIQGRNADARQDESSRGQSVAPEPAPEGYAEGQAQEEKDRAPAGPTKEQEQMIMFAAENSHLLGVPRRIVLAGINALAMWYCKLLNSTRIHNQDRLLDMVMRRPKGVPLITVSNHMSVIDDPFLWGQWRLNASNPNYCRWTLVAKDVCFPNVLVGYLFRLAKCIPIDRRGGIEQPGMEEAVQRIRKGEWLHIFPEGGITQTKDSLRRLKWGLASLILKASLPDWPPGKGDDADKGGRQEVPGVDPAGVKQEGGGGEEGAAVSTVVDVGPSVHPPIILCVGHSGFETLMPEPKAFGKRAIAPLWFQRISIAVGEPFCFDVIKLREMAQRAVGSTDPELRAFGAEGVEAPGGMSREQQNAPGTGPGPGPGASPLPSGMSPLVAGPGGASPLADPECRPLPSAAGPAEGQGERRASSTALKDEATRRLFSHITAEVRDQLWKVVTTAHKMQDRGRPTREAP